MKSFVLTIIIIVFLISIMVASSIHLYSPRIDITENGITFHGKPGSQALVETGRDGERPNNSPMTTIGLTGVVSFSHGGSSTTDQMYTYTVKPETKMTGTSIEYGKRYLIQTTTRIAHHPQNLDSPAIIKTYITLIPSN